MRVTRLSSTLKRATTDAYGKKFSRGEMVVYGNLLEPDTLDCMGADTYTVDVDREAICHASEVLTERFTNSPIRVFLTRVHEDEPDHLVMDQGQHDGIMKTITG